MMLLATLYSFHQPYTYITHKGRKSKNGNLYFFAKNPNNVNFSPCKFIILKYKPHHYPLKFRIKTMKRCTKTMKITVWALAFAH